MTRLEFLCKLHKQNGGTIHQFNSQYNTDWLAFSNFQFKCMILLKFGNDAYVKAGELFETETLENFVYNLKNNPKVLN